MDFSLETMMLEVETKARAWGISDLKPKQAEVLRYLASRRNVFASLPTGFGKSLCFWMPAAAWEWRVWVISPLVSLINDQAMACEARGIRVIAWQQSDERNRQIMEKRMIEGDWQICFISPERFVSWSNSGYLKHLRNAGLDADLFVLDEMHCFEEWRSFRDSYLQSTAPLRSHIADGSLLLGLSASMSETESCAWMAELCASHEIVSGGLGRENLHLQVLAVETEDERWMALISALRGLRYPDSALVYCHTREEVDDLTRWLRSFGIPAVAFHAGLPSEERQSRTMAFRRGLLRVICATCAFGMGIDYPHVTRVIHFSMPKDLESYWQEVGRSGRGGMQAYSIAIWRRSEISRARILDDESMPGFFSLWRAWAGGKCRKSVVGEKLGFPEMACGKCDVCRRSSSAEEFLIEPGFPKAWWIEPEAQIDKWVEKRISETESSKKSFSSASVPRDLE